MTKQVINTGTAANDGTGDTIRGAMTKTNANFSEIYSALGNGDTLRTINEGIANELAYYGDANTISRAGGLSFDRTTKRMRLDGTSAVGATGAILTLADNNGSTMNIFEYSDNSAVSPGIILVKHRGSLATPLAPLDGDLLGSYSVWSTVDGSAGSSFSAGRVSWLATEETPSGVNTKITIQARVDGTVIPVLESNIDGSVKVSGAYNLPLTDGTAGQTLTTDGEGTLQWTTPLKLDAGGILHVDGFVSIRGSMELRDGMLTIISSQDSVEGYLTYYTQGGTVGIGLVGRPGDTTLPGGNVALNGGAASEQQHGGNVSILAGADWVNENGFSGDGGNVTIMAGQGGNDNEDSKGGDITVYAGPAYKDGGHITIEAGSTYGGMSGQAGNLTLKAGSVSTGVTGNVVIEAGVFEGGEFAEAIPAFDGTVSIKGRDITLTAVQKVILAGGDIGGAGGHLQLKSMTTTSRDEIAGDYWGKGTVFYNETAGTIQVNTSDTIASFKTLFSLEELKTVVAASTDFTDFQARIAAL